MNVFVLVFHTKLVELTKDVAWVRDLLNNFVLFLSTGHQSSLQVLYSTCKTPASTAKKTLRNIPQVPERILDAPEILDDYCKYILYIV